MGFKVYGFTGEPYVLPMSNTKLTARLNEAIAVEHTLAMHCFLYETTVSGLWRVSLGPLFKELGDEARDHARLFGQKVVALGATPACAVGPVQAARSAEEMVDTLLALETQAIALYASALETVEDGDVAMRNMLEDHIDAEQRHIDEIALVAGRTQKAVHPTVRAAS